MMKVLASCLFALLIVVVSSCGNSQNSDKEQQQDWAPPTTVRPDIIDLDALHYSDTITINGKLTSYTFDFAPDRSLPVVVNAEGQKYHDNAASLVIMQGGDTIFRQRFTKRAFADYMTQYNDAQVGLVGFNYNISRLNDHSRLSFIAIVGDPDASLEKETFVEIRILSDNQYALQLAEGLETEPLDPDLRQDPEFFGE
ncbi:MAG: DUF4738 domain-containing protein [Prevotellaceae bacterium]|nr:DUF4738 domain-containing protein [Prevotellaceae bacterium]